MNGPDAGRAPPRLGAPLIRVDELGSTNDLARLLAVAGLPEGTVVVARRQTHGRGRYGRTWVSPPGGLWCSIVLRPTLRAGWGRLGLAASVAGAEAIDEAAGVRSTIRWPNDVMVAGKKVAGVLLEGAGDTIIVGIGINANVDLDALPQDVRGSAASLHEVARRPIGLESLLEGLLARAGYWYAAWARGGPEVIDAWATRDATRGSRVVVDSQGTRVEGVADGADHDGALRVRLASGEVRRVLAGDLLPARRAGRQEPTR